MTGLMSNASAAVAVRAVEDNDVTPGVIGFVVVALLGVATWLLIRSMNRQIKKIDLPEGGAPTGRDAAPLDTDSEPPDGEDRRD